MSAETKWKVNQEVLSSKIDDEAILMSIAADSYFGLDPVGSRIWEILSTEAASVDELIAILIEEYEVDEKTCREDVLEFIETMSTRKLINQV
jgi:hypothetical protein